jgi:2-polyprenyl-3-methyl-5-hydroxy-6-metoxy-1,4-benzoquinol methylase
VPDILANRLWQQYNWTREGEEWSEWWGSSFTQWVTTVYPRIGSYFPTKSILEIAPGYGRWTRFLVHGSELYRGVDLSQNCVEFCEQRFQSQTHAKFFKNDGRDLSAVGDNKYDLVFSFDSLVHVDMDVMVAYIGQIVGLLAPKGVAFLHHSNFGMYQGPVHNTHWRGTNVTAMGIEQSVKDHGGQLLTQEILSWGEEYILNDCFSLFGRAEDYPNIRPAKIISKMFMEEEVGWAKRVVSKYNVLERQ